MRYRNWLLLLPALTLAYFVVLTVGPLISMFSWLVMSNDRTSMVLWLGLAGLASWTALEITAFRASRAPMACACGYHLRGLKCPECGEPVGR